MILFRALFAAAILLFAPVEAQQLYVSALGNQPFQQLKIGGGGFVTRIDVNPTTGTKLARTDTYGAYKWNGTSWNQLETAARMPATVFGFYPANTSDNQVYYGGPLGVFEISSAPSNSSIIYYSYSSGAAATGGGQQGHVFKSTDGGSSFADTGFAAACDCKLTANGLGSRLDGPKMMIDPVNPNVVFTSTTANGVWATTDGGATWAQVSTGTLAVATEYTMAFDISDLTGNTAYVCVQGTGVYASVNAAQGASAAWTLTTSGPTNCAHLTIAAKSGYVWVTAGNNGGSGVVWRYTGGGAGGTWVSAPGSPGSWHSVTVDPATCGAAHNDITQCSVILGGGTGGGNITASVNGGTSWTASASFTRSCTNDVAWLCTTNEFFMSNADMVFDLDGTIWFSQGIGAWNATPGYSIASTTWNARSIGIENLVTFGGLIAPNGVPIIGVEDRGISPVLNPTKYTDATNLFVLGQARNLLNSTSQDFVASNPCFMVAQVGGNSGNGFDWSGTSSDCGTTWIPFNSWNATVAASAISDNGSGLVRVTVPSTTGLTTWSAGVGSIVTVLQRGQTTNAANLSDSSFQATVVDGAHIDLQHSTFIAANALAAAGSYLLYVPTRPSATNNGSYLIQNVANSGGKFQLAMNTGAPMPANGVVVNVTGSTCCDGWWITSGLSGVTTILQDSTFAAGWSGAGQMGGITQTGGSIASSTTQNFIKVPENNSYPHCTTDGGLTWNEIGVTASGSPHYSVVTGASWSGGTVTYILSGNVNILVGQKFSVVGASPSGFNVPNTTTATGGSGNTVTATIADPGSPWTSGGTLAPAVTGWGATVTNNQTLVAADRRAANKFYMFNTIAGAIYPVTNCTPGAALSVVGNNTSYFSQSGFNSRVATVPGQAGHFFWGVGEVGSGGQSHPASGFPLWRSCDGGVTMMQMTGVYEPWFFALGKAAPGKNYPAIYYWGWYSATPSINDAVFGLWRSIDDPNFGLSTCSATAPTFEKLADFPLGWQGGPQNLAVSLTIYGQVFTGNGNGFAYGVFNFLLNRDLSPAANDNTPMFLNQAA